MTPAPIGARPGIGIALRCAGVAIAISLIVLWIVFFRTIFAGLQGMPAPSGFMLPAFFCCLAFGAGLSAARGDGIPVALAGGLSLFPMGFFLVLFPGPTRVIGLLDLALVATGIALMRREDRSARAAGRDEAEPLDA